MTLSLPPPDLPPPPDTSSPPSTSLSPTLIPSPATTPLPSPALVGTPLDSQFGGHSKAQCWCEDSAVSSSSVASLVQDGSVRKSYKKALVSSKPFDSKDVGGWVRVDRRRVRGLDRSPSKALEPPPMPVLVDLRGRCFNCFLSGHRAVECRNRVRCFLCRLLGHRLNVCPRQRVAPSLPKRSLVWRPVSKETLEVRLGMAGGSMVDGAAGGDGMKKRTRRGQRNQKAGARSGLGDHGAPVGGSPLLAPVVASSPALDSAWPLSFIGRSGRIDQAEVELRRSLIVSVIGQEGPGCAAEVRDAIASRFGLEADTIRLRRAMPNSFLIFFPSEDLTDHVVDGGQSLHVPPLRLHVRRWSHQAFASGSGQLHAPLDIELRGVLAQL